MAPAGRRGGGLASVHAADHHDDICMVMIYALVTESAHALPKTPLPVADRSGATASCAPAGVQALPVVARAPHGAPAAHW